jgi:hypothetical protein
MKSKVKRLKDECWRLFSIYIRLRDCLRTTGSPYWGECITCDEQKEFGELEAGHFVSRIYNSTFFDERNVHAQCGGCNGFRHGEQYIHGQKIDEIHGKGTADELQRMKSETRKFTISELEEFRETLKEKIRMLEDGR